jgi:hypothetical protein
MQRRLLAWVAGVFGAAWLLRRFRARPQPAADPADELRQKLQESRDEAAVPEPEPPPEQPAATEPEPEAPLEERRRAVYERGRTAIDRMRGTDASSGER